MGILATIQKLNKFATDIRARFRTVENRVNTLEQNSASWNYITATANRTLVSRDFIWQGAASLQFTLPLNPAAGARVAINTIDTSSKVLRNGQRIMGKVDDLPLNIANITVYLTYKDATRGWVLT